MGQKYAYLRISSKGQHIRRQAKEFEDLGITNITIDRGSGKDINANLKILLASLTEGDTLYIVSFDRLGRSLTHNLNILEDLRARNVKVHALKEGVIVGGDNYDFRSEFSLQIFSAVAQLERNLLKERQLAGIALRKKQRPNSYNAHSIKRAQLLRNRKFHENMRIKTREYMMEKYSLGRSSYYSYRRLVLNKDK